MKWQQEEPVTVPASMTVCHECIDYAKHQECRDANRRWIEHVAKERKFDRSHSNRKQRA